MRHLEKVNVLKVKSQVTIEFEGQQIHCQKAV